MGLNPSKIRHLTFSRFADDENAVVTLHVERYPDDDDDNSRVIFESYKLGGQAL